MLGKVDASGKPVSSKDEIPANPFLDEGEEDISASAIFKKLHTLM